MKLSTLRGRCMSTTRLAASRVLSFGDGSQGALGLSDAQDRYEPEVVPLPPDIVSIGSGHHHSLAIDASGTLWSWGRNSEMQLGRQSDDSGHAGTSGTPAPVPGVKARACAASGVVTAVVGCNGALYMLGSSKRGQLGLGPGVAEAHRPTHVPGLDGIWQVACGWGHTLALREDGAVFSWGFPQHGRLGHAPPALAQEAEEDVMQHCEWTPRRIAALEGHRIVQVACTMDSSLAVSDEGLVFTVGDDSLGQLGRGGEQTNWANRPSAANRGPEAWLVHAPDGQPLRAGHVAAGLAHCLAVALPSGRVFSWGWDGGKQLGLGEQAPAGGTASTPRAVFGLPGNRGARLAAGRAHSVALSDDVLSDSDDDLGPSHFTQLYTWGSGRNGRLGQGTSQSFYAPELVVQLDGEDMLQAACGYDHTLVLCCD